MKNEVEFVIASEDDVTAAGWEGTLIKPNNPLVLGVYPSHPFADRTHVHLHELANERLILVSQEYSFRRFTDRIFEKAGISPNCILECDFALRATMFNDQYGVLLSTASVKETGFSPDTVFIPVIEPIIDRPWYIYRHPHSMRSDTASLFWDFMTAFYMERES